jgi:hypothetical protein
MCGSEPLGLHEDGSVRDGSSGSIGHIGPIGSYDNGDPLCPGGSRCGKNVLQDAPACDFVQHLGPGRPHARAFAGGENNGEAAAQ